ncbi:amino acid ABC transporter permease [Trueperella bialowiezensis]|uniref:L-cystine transport system permease protein tcyB n=1 Tax=Trueperella bialowiezensis TaxID=312285 RepID=A0A448PG49_9ACTO|nr:amino acid ABC transporter permease [Trueperella bialowiezensis]VEI13902.1 L-cystine transport system permease protein tcyB [Trueperella bialowiezensis]
MQRAIEIWSESFPTLLSATVKVTIPLAVVSFLLAFAIGIVVAIVRFERVPVLSQLGAVYVWIFRGTPLLVQLFIVFFGLGSAGIQIDAWPAAICTLAANTGAYNAEALRGGLTSVPKGQWEAGRSLNLTHVQILRYVVVPQGFRVAIPTLTSNFIDLVKGTSLVSSITLVDVFLQAQFIASRNFEPLLMYIQVAVIYLVISTLLTWLQMALEKRTSRFIESDA